MKKSLPVLLMLSLSVILIVANCTPTTTTNNQVVMLGDSIFALSGEIANELRRLSGQTYRSYYVSGAEMEGGTVTPIPTQYTQARNADRNIRTIIMDGCGNDIQIGASSQCTSGSVTTACKNALQPALTAADNLFKQMRADGVKNIVYMNYFYIMNANSKPAFNWMHDEMAKVVQKYNGLIVDPMPYMKDSYIGPDRIHPTTAGSQMLANLIWDAMKANCIEQPSGCTPSSSSSSTSSTSSSSSTTSSTSGGGCN
ncbi:MAG: SGNH/GDSL hydrolase family protein [Desulfobacteraceae bacterium]|nr:SGNH/GDSL hydrolase family protein [Desulfobacteraceae bacterium]